MLLTPKWPKSNFIWFRWNWLRVEPSEIIEKSKNMAIDNNGHKCLYWIVFCVCVCECYESSLSWSFHLSTRRLLHTWVVCHFIDLWPQSIRHYQYLLFWNRILLIYWPTHFLSLAKLIILAFCSINASYGNNCSVPDNFEMSISLEGNKKVNTISNVKVFFLVNSRR